MTPQQMDYYNKLSADYLMKNDNPVRNQVFELYGNINHAVNPEDSTTTTVTNVVENSEDKRLPFAIGNDYDPITKQPIQTMTIQGENGFYGSDKDANGNELQSWSITVDEQGIRHATIHDGLGARKMSDEQFTKYMLQTMELRDPQNEAQSHTSELIDQIMDARIQVDDTNLQYNDTSLFLSTSEDGRSGILWTMNENEPPHFYEVTNGQKIEVDLARACEQQENIDKELQKIGTGKFHDQLQNFVADCQMTSAFTDANNLKIYAQEYNQALNLSPAQETVVADDLSRVTNISNDGILVIEKNGTVTYAYHDPLAQGDIKMVRIDSDGTEHPIHSQTGTAQKFFAENKELFTKAGLMNSDFATAAYGAEVNNEDKNINNDNHTMAGTSTHDVNLTNLHIMAATERATEFGLTGGDTRSVEAGQYQGTVVTKAENGWQIRYPEGNSVILKAENETLSGMFVDSDDKVTNMKPQEVEQYRQAAADAYKNSQTTYGKTSSNTGTHSGRMVGHGNGYI